MCTNQHQDERSHDFDYLLTRSQYALRILIHGIRSCSIVEQDILCRKLSHVCFEMGSRYIVHGAWELGACVRTIQRNIRPLEKNMLQILLPKSTKPSGFCVQ